MWNVWPLLQREDEFGPRIQGKSDVTLSFNVCNIEDWSLEG